MFFLSRILYSNICGIKFYSTSVTEYIPYCPILNECFYILLQSINLTTRHKLQCVFFKFYSLPQYKNRMVRQCLCMCMSILAQYSNTICQTTSVFVVGAIYCGTPMGSLFFAHLPTDVCNTKQHESKTYHCNKFLFISVTHMHFTYAIITIFSTTTRMKKRRTRQRGAI